MRLVIIAVGRLKAGPERELVELYRERLRPAPGKLGPLDVIEIDERKDEKRIADGLIEAAAALAPGAKLIALDERGQEMTTRRLADALVGWRDGGVPEAAFVIGGADGLSEQIRERAQLTLCLGRMTWPHRLARAMLAEQLYRAASLVSGHPYHRE